MNFRHALVVLLFLVPITLGQTTVEEKLRKDFVRSLEKKRKNEKPAPEKSAPIATAPKIAAPTDEADDGEVIKVDTRLVRVDVLVRDQKGNSILGLKADDFVIRENSVEQEVGTFSIGVSEEVPRSIVLIIDYSGSQKPYIETSALAAKLLVDKLNPRDRMAIVTDDIKLLVDFTRDKELLKDSLNKLWKKAEKGDVGKSLQFSALYSVLEEMFDDEDIRPIIIFQTDADQLTSIKRDTPTYQFPPALMTNFTDRALITSVERSRATIYSVISGFSVLGLTPEERVQKATAFLSAQYPKIIQKHPEDVGPFAQRLLGQQNSMVNIAKISGGFAENLERPDQADAIYERILSGITDRYLIGYYPSDPTFDGKRRNVRIDVKNHPEYVVIGRRFYYPPAQNASTK